MNVKAALITAAILAVPPLCYFWPMLAVVPAVVMFVGASALLVVTLYRLVEACMQ